MGEPEGWYVDEDLLDVYRVLRSARRKEGDVHGPICGCGVCPTKATRDLDWLPRLRDQGWAIITHDGFKSVGERDAVKDLGLGVFRLKWRRSIPSWDRVRLVFARWEDMESVWGSEARPFIYAITRHQGPRRENL